MTNEIKFEKLSTLTEEPIILPRRNDEGSAGYDFYAHQDIEIYPGDSVIIKTGIKARMPKDVVLMLYPRSSLGFKGIKLANTTGIIDSSYYNNEKNEGHIMVNLVNESGKPVYINKGDKFCQGLFITYLTTEDDVPVNQKRIGGIGSSGK